MKLLKSNEDPNMRLSRYIAQAGVCSRRQADTEILQGHITVNGKVVDQVGVQVDETQDEIRYRGKLIRIEKKRYFLFYKPTGCLSSVRDPFGRPTVSDWFQQFPERLYPVGRLDINTSGLLLVSNDGDFVHRMIHPRYKIAKTYQVLVRGQVLERQIQQLLQGVLVEDEMVAADEVKYVKKLHEETVLNITIHQGKKRQIRMMCSAIGHPVIRLVRIQFGFLTLENLKPGEYRALTTEEIQKLLKLTQTEPFYPTSDTKK